MWSDLAPGYKPRMAGAYALFKAAERLELLASELYLALAARFAGDRDAVTLFRRLADEEVQHAARIRLLFAQYRNDPRLFQGASGLGPGAPDVEALVRETAVAVAAVRDGDWVATLDEAVARVAALEERCASVHAELLASGADRAALGFFEELARQDRQHQQLLAAMARRRSA